MSSFDSHLNALQNEMNQMSHLVQKDKENFERIKQDLKGQQSQMTTVLDQYQSNNQELMKQQKIIEKYSQLMAQYLPHVPQEAQVQLTNEYEKIKQSMQAHADPHQAMAQNMMATGNLAAMGGMPPGLNAMMALQAQAQLGRGMIPGMPAPSPRVQKTNGIPNGIPGLPPNMANGLNAQMAAMQNPAMLAAAAAGMPGIAQLQAMAAFSNMHAMSAMPGFNPAQQLAAMQSMAASMNGMMLPPMSAANHALGGMVNPLGLSVSTPSRNPSNGGPLSGTRTPQSAPSNGVNSPRATVKEEPTDIKKEEVSRSSPTEDSVAVA